MLPYARQHYETIESWEVRLKAEHPARERAYQRDIVMTLPEHEYRRRVAEASIPIKREPKALPDARTLNDEEYALALAKAGYHRQSLR